MLVMLSYRFKHEGYFLSTDQVNVSWAKVYNQLIKNNGTSVTPRKNVNIVGATFTDSSETDTTTITFSDTANNADVYALMGVL